MRPDVPYGQGARMLALTELCEWLNITERHARKLVERQAIPYRKVGHLLRFPEAEVEEWSHPKPRHIPKRVDHRPGNTSARLRPVRVSLPLPKSLIEWPSGEEKEHAKRQSGVTSPPG